MESGGPSRIVGMVWRHKSARNEEFQTLATQTRTILKSRDLPVTVVS
jgi:hypothetical protein